MFKKIAKHTRFVLKQLFFWLVSALIPKNKKLWVFGAWQGKLYADNTKYLFEYANENLKEVRCVWITQNPAVVEQVNALGYEAYCLPSTKAYMTLLRAGVVIQTEGNRDVGGYCLCWTKVVQLWHGIGGKKVNWTTNRSPIQKLYDRLFVDNHKKSYLMTSSNEGSKIMCSVLGFDMKRCYPTGYPRNDVFINWKRPSKLKEELDAQYPNCRKIIYMPTHRNFGTEGQMFGARELKYVDELLKDNQIVMVFKPHFHELKNYLGVEGELTNIILAKNEEKYSDVYSYLADFDLLISDYSSVINDFTCAKKPIVLFPYDLEIFRNTDAGLFESYEGMPIGPFCYTWGEVLQNVVMLLKEDTWKERREAYRRIYHPYDDGNNAKRVCKVILKEVLRLS